MQIRFHLGAVAFKDIKENPVLGLGYGENIVFKTLTFILFPIYIAIFIVLFYLRLYKLVSLGFSCSCECSQYLSERLMLSFELVPALRREDLR
jgi:hypothetical protein